MLNGPNNDLKKTTMNDFLAVVFVVVVIGL